VPRDALFRQAEQAKTVDYTANLQQTKTCGKLCLPVDNLWKTRKNGKSYPQFPQAAFWQTLCFHRFFHRLWKSLFALLQRVILLPWDDGKSALFPILNRLSIANTVAN
jgi:hypothetical protein